MIAQKPIEYEMDCLFLKALNAHVPIGLMIQRECNARVLMDDW